MNEVEYGWQVWNVSRDELEVSGVCPSLLEAKQEALRCAAQYSQDGAVQVRIYESRKLEDFAVGGESGTDESEPEFVRGKPEGYYLIGTRGDTEWSLVYLYHHPQLLVRCVSFGHQDGSALVPVCDLEPERTILVPAHVEPASVRATRISDFEGVYFSGQGVGLADLVGS